MKNYLPLVLGVIAISSCVASKDLGVGKPEAGEGIFYTSQADADAALDAFDKANPNCQLWTNWQKMCSRTGAKGEVWCTTDPERPVKPSVPFCAGDGDGIDEIEEPGPTITQRSRDRFCISYDEDSTYAKRIGRRVCLDKDESRPFNGKRMSARLHPWCAEWKDRETFRAANLNQSMGVKSGYYCSNIQAPPWCSEVEGMGLIPMDSPDHPDFGKGRIAILGIVDTTANARVVGVFCRRKSE